MSYPYEPGSEQQTIFPFTSGEKEAAIICPVHRHVNLCRSDYLTQLSRPDSFWKCPICGSTSDWDDDNYDLWCQQNIGTWQKCEVCNGTGIVTCKRCGGTGWVGGLAGEICCGGTDDCPGCDGAGGAYVKQEM